MEGGRTSSAPAHYEIFSLNQSLDSLAWDERTNERTNELTDGRTDGRGHRYRGERRERVSKVESRDVELEKDLALVCILGGGGARILA